MIGDFWVPYTEASLGQRAEITVAHLGHILPRLCNIVSNVAKVAFFGLACMLSLGQSALLNKELTFACKRTLANIAGVVTSALGILFPVSMLEVQFTLDISLLLPELATALNTEEMLLKFPFLFSV